MLAGAALGAAGYFAYLTAQGDLVTRMVIRAVSIPTTQGGPTSEDFSAAAYGTMPLAFFAFLFFTPTGLAALYLSLSGLFRAATAWADDPRGDPILSGTDALVHRIRSRHATRQAIRLREQLEGREVPDRLLTGASAGFPEADFVVVASRRKPEWTPGTIVISGDTWYRLGAAAQRDTPVGLRTLYPLSEVKDLQVMRRSVVYELPPLSGKSQVTGSRL